MTAADAVVVGGGTVGAWCAYFLRRSGLARVVLIEKGLLGQGASSRAAGVVRLQGGTPEAVRLAQWSRRFYLGQRDEFGTDSGFTEQGYLLPCFAEAEVAAARERMAMQSALGVPVRWLGPDEADAANPALAPGQTLGGTFCALDGYISPPRNVTAYTVALLRAGVEIAEHVAFRGLAADGVQTSRGRIAAGLVVLTGGPALAAVGRLAGIRIPAGGARHQVAVTERHPGLDPSRLPMVFDVVAGLYWRPEEGGLLFGMSNPDEPPGGNREIDADYLAKMRARLARLVPVTAGLGLRRVWAATIDYTPDHLPIIGRAPGLDHVTVASAGGAGMMWGPAVARAAADVALAGASQVLDVAPLGLDRFDDAGRSRLAADPVALPFPERVDARLPGGPVTGVRPGSGRAAASGGAELAGAVRGSVVVRVLVLAAGRDHLRVPVARGHQLDLEVAHDLRPLNGDQRAERRGHQETDKPARHRVFLPIDGLTWHLPRPRPLTPAQECVKISQQRSSPGELTGRRPRKRAEGTEGRMLPTQRRQAILTEVREASAVSAEHLARRFGVSLETIRRDLRGLRDMGLLERVYGGALSVRSSEGSFTARTTLHRERKQAIARLAVTLIAPDATIVIDVGTTALEVARALPASFRGKVLTNSVPAAMELAARDDIELLLAGGQVRPGDAACSGAHAEAFFGSCYADMAFLGSGGVHAGAGLTDYHLAEVSTRRTIIAHAAASYVLADSSKLGTIAVHRVCPLDRVTAVLTDHLAGAEAVDALTGAGCTVLAAPPPRALPCPPVDRSDVRGRSGHDQPSSRGRAAG